MNWEASIQDYEALLHEMPGDEDVSKALVEAQLQLKKQRGDDIKAMKNGDNLIQITMIDQFRQYSTSPGKHRFFFWWIIAPDRIMCFYIKEAKMLLTIMEEI